MLFLGVLRCGTHIVRLCNVCNKMHVIMKSLSSILELLSTSTTVFSLLEAIDFHLKGPFLVLVWIDVL